MASRKAEKERLRQERLAREREMAAAARRRRLFQIYGMGGGALVAVVVIVLVVVLTGSSSGTGSSAGHSNPSHGNPPILRVASTNGLKLQRAPSPGPLGPEVVPIPQGPPLASNASSATGGAVDGIQCNAGEQTLFHVHTHLTIFVNGAPRQIPYGIGIEKPLQLQQSASGPFVAGGNCFYWLHTHAADGIVHIESPAVRVYTLGDFFDIWGQPLGPNQVGPVQGKVTAFYNGKLYTGPNPRNIPIGDHVQIQLDVGTPLIAPETINWSPTGL